MTLVDDLRAEAESGDNCRETSATMGRAADRIAELEADNQRLRLLDQSASRALTAARTMLAAAVESRATPTSKWYWEHPGDCVAVLALVDGTLRALGETSSAPTPTPEVRCDKCARLPTFRTLGGACEHATLTGERVGIDRCDGTYRLGARR